MPSRGIIFLSIYEKSLKYSNKKVHSIDIQITNLVCPHNIQVSNNQNYFIKYKLVKLQQILCHYQHYDDMMITWTLRQLKNYAQLSFYQDTGQVGIN